MISANPKPISPGKLLGLAAVIMGSIAIWEMVLVFLWMFCSAIIYTVGEHGYIAAPEEIWILIALFVPLLLALTFYKVAARWNPDRPRMSLERRPTVDR
jgi:hypothetical protein